MLKNCANPQCAKPLHYLRDGRVFVFDAALKPEEVNGAKAHRMEHFWLCGPCYAGNDFHFAADGSVTVERRARHTPVGDLETWLDPTLVA